jgi:hypothetical protein
MTPFPLEETLDVSDKKQWMFRQCDAGEGDACWLLGQNFSRGGSSPPWGYFPQSDERAAQLFGKGCKVGSPQACGQLGHSLLKGLGVTQDIPRGASLAVSSCERGYEFACMDAAMVLYDGTGIAPDRERARRDLIAACTAGNPGACLMEKDLYGTQMFAASDPPAGAVGVEFGTPLRDVESRCRATGHTWSGDNTGGFCDGPISASTPYAFLAFACAGRVCGLMVTDLLSTQPPSSWLTRFDETEKRLETRYGPPSTRTKTVTRACLDVAALPQCIASGAVVYNTEWAWERKYGVLMKLANREHGPVIIINYMTPEDLKSGRASGL